MQRLDGSTLFTLLPLLSPFFFLCVAFASFTFMEEKIQAEETPALQSLCGDFPPAPTLTQKPTLARLEVTLTGGLEWRAEASGPDKHRLQFC